MTCASGKDLICLVYSKLEGTPVGTLASPRRFRFHSPLWIVSVEEGDGPYHALATKNGEHD